MTFKLNPLEVTERTIPQYKQNKISLITTDLSELAGVDPMVTAKVLMARGVYKWLEARRLLIALKDYWKSEISAMQGLLTEYNHRRLSPKEYVKKRRLAAQMNQLIECREAICTICHGPRWTSLQRDRHEPLFNLGKGEDNASHL